MFMPGFQLIVEADGAMIGGGRKGEEGVVGFGATFCIFVLQGSHL